MKLTIIGCGSIGRTLARHMQDDEDIESMFVLDRKRDAVEALEAECPKVRYAESLDDVLGKSDLVVEAASQSAVRDFIPGALEAGRDVLVMSVGAFTDDDFREKCRILAKQNNCRVYIPSGAVCGMDGITAASQGEVEEIILMTYKPVGALRDARYLKKKGIDLDNLRRPKVVFSGHPEDAVRRFPRNINVAATLSLASLDVEHTIVKIIVDPKATRNTHRVIAKGSFGEIECWSRNAPFPDNPRTSYLAALSLISAVQKIKGSFWVGV